MKTLVTIVGLVVMAGVAGWAEKGNVTTVTNAASVIVTNVVISNLPESRSIPPTTTNVVVLTNSIPVVPRIDTSRLVEMFTGTDEGTKKKVGVAIEAIRAGDFAVASENLRSILTTTALSEDQEIAIKMVLDKLP